jgi:hypothetical protein
MSNLLAQIGSGIAGPPYKMRQNETIYWEDTPYSDRFNNTLDSNSYGLTYAFAGPSATPVTVTATPSTGANSSSLGGGGWTSQFTATQAALMIPGTWWWQAILTGYSAAFNGNIVGQALTVTSGLTGQIVAGAAVNGAGVTAGTTIVSGSGNNWIVSISQSVGTEAMTAAVSPARIVPAEGQITVEVDLSTSNTIFDGRSTMQKGLDTWEAAFAALTGSNGNMPVRQYTIGTRHLQYQDLKEIQSMIDWFRGRVNAEKAKASGGQDRMIRQGFSPPSSGNQTSNSRNWPWW